MNKIIETEISEGYEKRWNSEFQSSKLLVASGGVRIVSALELVTCFHVFSPRSESPTINSLSHSFYQVVSP
jgi:hypothetical protein